MMLSVGMIVVLVATIMFLRRSNRSLKGKNKELKEELKQSVELNQKIIHTLQSQIDFKRDISRLTSSELISELREYGALRAD